MDCKICEEVFDDKRSFGYHLQFKHKTKVEDYIIKYFYNSQRPTCPICNEKTRYVRSDYAFKKYCKNHAKEAMKEGGKKGGQAQAWNIGLTKENDERIAKQARRQCGEGNPFYGKSHTQESKDKLRKVKRISKEEFDERTKSRNEFIVLTDYSSYNSRQHQYLELECSKCNLIQGKTLQAFERGSLCPICYPFTVSIAQIEIVNFIRELGIEPEISTRKIIPPQELDIYVPDKKFAIEYNSLYYHKDRGDPGFSKHYHKTKTDLCKNNGIRLFHIFGDEWADKKDIVKSMIKNRLNIGNVRLGARKCKIIELKKNDATDFFDANHIDGYSRSKICFGLTYENKVVCAISLRIPSLRSKHNGKIEIARFASLMGYQVLGGFSKLLKRCIEWTKENDFRCIMTYADLRFGEGKVYLDNGFDFVRDTGLNYWYTDDVVRYDRFRFRAKDGKSEKQIAEENKVYRIYGCGNYLYEMEIENSRISGMV